MARTKKSVSQKEQELIDIIERTKKKLHKLQNKQIIELGKLACKYGLNEFDLSTVDEEFRHLALNLKSKN
jgi:hypothetical protein